MDGWLAVASCARTDRMVTSRIPSRKVSPSNRGTPVGNGSGTSASVLMFSRSCMMLYVVQQAKLASVFRARTTDKKQAMIVPSCTYC